MKTTTKKLTQTAVLLALCIASQFLKNLSVYITGPIVNCIIIIAVLEVGLSAGAVISVIAPITSFIITGSPVMKAMPMIIPAVMAGNVLMALFLWMAVRKEQTNLKIMLGLSLGTVIKSVFMALTISMIIIPLMGPKTQLPEIALTTARLTFSLTQLITAAVGSLIGFAVWQPLKKALNTEK